MPAARNRQKSKEEEDVFSYFADMWALGVIEMMRNQELCQTFSKISDPRWSCFTVEICGSAAPELFFRSCSSPKHALTPTFSGFFCHGIKFDGFLLQEDKIN
jgi:hypothetical protein